ncbi:hypothetical protein H696_03177 [Fonticula alba]|uniref:Uncharacterized protein n=1 Tax=Fonticula alba TaxID=691883 RepID=A0A058Z967_FONAL|nr:hypothetical protein H696_03177 [Fonticula alba]KCV70820.1 hypothetical protein H696_03177 [Fonticula alba]|eukprot:XP_009495336.1 hypothetical protein H696_03177 [Fonticula alba]
MFTDSGSAPAARQTRLHQFFGGLDTSLPEYFVLHWDDQLPRAHFSRSSDETTLRTALGPDVAVDPGATERLCISSIGSFEWRQGRRRVELLLTHDCPAGADRPGSLPCRGLGSRCRAAGARPTPLAGAGLGSGADEGCFPLTPEARAFISPGAVSMLKSHLQKCVRRQRAGLAVQTAKHLATLDMSELLRRLPIIAVEDVAVHFQVPVVIWLMSAHSRGFRLTGAQFDWVLGWVHLLAGGGLVPWAEHGDLSGPVVAGPGPNARAGTCSETRPGKATSAALAPPRPDADPVPLQDAVEGACPGASTAPGPGPRDTAGNGPRSAASACGPGAEVPTGGPSTGGPLPGMTLCDPPDWSAGSSFTLGSASLFRLSAPVRDLLLSLQLRRAYGGMAGDMAMLDNMTRRWMRRFGGALAPLAAEGVPLTVPATEAGILPGGMPTTGPHAPECSLSAAVAMLRVAAVPLASRRVPALRPEEWEMAAIDPHCSSVVRMLLADRLAEGSARKRFAADSGVPGSRHPVSFVGVWSVPGARPGSSSAGPGSAAAAAAAAATAAAAESADGGDAGPDGVTLRQCRILLRNEAIPERRIGSLMWRFDGSVNRRPAMVLGGCRCRGADPSGGEEPPPKPWIEGEAAQGDALPEQEEDRRLWQAIRPAVHILALRYIRQNRYL